MDINYMMMANVNKIVTHFNLLFAFYTNILLHLLLVMTVIRPNVSNALHLQDQLRSA